MMDNCNYNKTKILYKLSKLVGFLEGHAIEDAKKAGHRKCEEFYSKLRDELDKHLEGMRILVEECAKDGKLK